MRYHRGGVKEGALNILPQAVSGVMQDKEGLSFSYIAGLILHEDRVRFKQMLFRRARGNIVTVLHDLEKPVMGYDGKTQKKTMYVAIIREGTVLQGVVRRVCEAFSSEM